MTHSFESPPAEQEAYWVEPGRVMAGAYPGEYDAADSERRIRTLLECGIRRFITLMQAREESSDDRHAPAYAPALERAAHRAGVDADFRRFDIHDMSVPSMELMDTIQGAIDEALGDERPVYVHCWRGRGRTGVVVGGYLIRRGLATQESFVEVIRTLRSKEGAGDSPETQEQIDFVRRWSLRR